MSTTIKYSFQDCLASEVKNISITPGTIIWCRDTGDIYYDTLSGERIQNGKFVIMLTDDEARTDILIPSADCLYVVKSTKKIWIYNGGWQCMNPIVPVTIYNVEVGAGNTITETESDIHVGMTGTMIPIPALFDLYDSSNFVVTVNEGSVSVKNNGTVDMYGMIYIK